MVQGVLEPLTVDSNSHVAAHGVGGTAAVTGVGLPNSIAGKRKSDKVSQSWAVTGIADV